MYDVPLCDVLKSTITVVAQNFNCIVIPLGEHLVLEASATQAKREPPAPGKQFHAVQAVPCSRHLVPRPQDATIYGVPPSDTCIYLQYHSQHNQARCCAREH